MALSNRSAVLSLSCAIAVGVLSCVALWRWDWILEWRHRNIGKLVAQGLFLFAVLVFFADSLREMVPSWRYHGGRTLMEDSDIDNESGEREPCEVAQDDVAKADADVAKADVAEEAAAQLLSSRREGSSSRGMQASLAAARKKQQMSLEEDARRVQAREKMRKEVEAPAAEVGRSSDWRRAEGAPRVFPGEELRGWVAPQVEERQRIRAQQDEELAESERVDRERMSAAQRAAELAERQVAEEEERERERVEGEENLKVQLRRALPEEPLWEEVGVVVVALRLSSGKRVKRRWRKSDRIRNVYNWFHSQDESDATDRSLQLATTFPRRLMPLAEWGEMTLEEAGWEAQTLLVTEMVD